MMKHELGTLARFMRPEYQCYQSIVAIERPLQPKMIFYEPRIMSQLDIETLYVTFTDQIDQLYFEFAILGRTIRR